MKALLMRGFLLLLGTGNGHELVGLATLWQQTAFDPV
jgi:hypothetical protein